MSSTDAKYLAKKFKKFPSFWALKPLHPDRKGIIKHEDDHVSAQIVIENEQGYVDYFKSNDIISYERSRFKPDNVHIDQLLGKNVGMDVYLNANAQGAGYWNCGKYLVTESSDWGWKLKRIHV